MAIKLRFLLPQIYNTSHTLKVFPSMKKPLSAPDLNRAAKLKAFGQVFSVESYLIWPSTAILKNQ